MTQKCWKRQMGWTLEGIRALYVHLSIFQRPLRHLSHCFLVLLLCFSCVASNQQPIGGGYVLICLVYKCITELLPGFGWIPGLVCAENDPSPSEYCLMQIWMNVEGSLLAQKYYTGGLCNSTFVSTTQRTSPASPIILSVRLETKLQNRCHWTVGGCTDPHLPPEATHSSTWQLQQAASFPKSLLHFLPYTNTNTYI